MTFVRRRDRPWPLRFLVEWASARLPPLTFTRAQFNEELDQPFDLQGALLERFDRVINALCEMQQEALFGGLRRDLLMLGTAILEVPD